MEAPSLGTFKARLDGVVRNLIPLGMSLLMVEGLDWMTLKGQGKRKPPSPNFLKFVIVFIKERRSLLCLGTALSLFSGRCYSIASSFRPTTPHLYMSCLPRSLPERC